MGEHKLAVAPRAAGVLAIFGVVIYLSQGLLPEALLPALGLVQSGLGAIARVPQIILNFKQGHTGNQSVITWGLSLGGNIVRVITTLVDVNDIVTLAGHAIAGVLNFTLVAQIFLFYSNTQKVL